MKFTDNKDGKKKDKESNKSSIQQPSSGRGQQDPSLQQNVSKEQPQSGSKPQQQQHGGAWHASGSQTQSSKGHGGAIKKVPKQSAKSTTDSLSENLPVLQVGYKKAPGKKGKKLPNIETNFLQLKNLDKLVENIYKYDIEMAIKDSEKEPKNDPKKDRKREPKKGPKMLQLMSFERNIFQTNISFMMERKLCMRRECYRLKVKW